MAAMATEESQEASPRESVLHHAPPDLEEPAQGRPGPDLLKAKGSQVELFIARGRYVAHVSCLFYETVWRESVRAGGSAGGGQNKRKGSDGAGG